MSPAAEPSPCPFELASAAAEHAQDAAVAALGEQVAPAERVRLGLDAPLALRVGLQRQQVHETRRVAEAEYERMLTRAAATTRATARRIEARAAADRDRRRAEAAALERTAAAERGSRLELFQRQASEDRERAGDVARKLATKSAGRAWATQARRPGEERVLGPVRAPRSMAEAEALLARFPEPTPYEAAFVFVLALNRLQLLRGPKSRKTSLALLGAALHPDCFCPPLQPGGERRIRKHVLLAAERCELEAVRSFVLGSTPFNDYAVDSDAIAVGLMAGAEQRGAYRNDPGADFEVGVRTSGAHRLGDEFRQLGMRYVAGAGWKVRDLTSLVTHRAVPAFDPDGAQTADEHEREQLYREEHRLPALPPFVPPSRPASAGSGEYCPPRASSSRLQTIDLAALAARKRKAAAADGTSPPGSADSALARARRARARERTVALARATGAEVAAEAAAAAAARQRPLSGQRAVVPDIEALG